MMDTRHYPPPTLFVLILTRIRRLFLGEKRPPSWQARSMCQQVLEANASRIHRSATVAIVGRNRRQRMRVLLSYDRAQPLAGEFGKHVGKRSVQLEPLCFHLEQGGCRREEFG